MKLGRTPVPYLDGVRLKKGERGLCAFVGTMGLSVWDNQKKSASEQTVGFGETQPGRMVGEKVWSSGGKVRE